MIDFLIKLPHAAILNVIALVFLAVACFFLSRAQRHSERASEHLRQAQAIAADGICMRRIQNMLGSISLRGEDQTDHLVAIRADLQVLCQALAAEDPPEDEEEPLRTLDGDITPPMRDQSQSLDRPEPNRADIVPPDLGEQIIGKNAQALRSRDEGGLG